MRLVAVGLLSAALIAAVAMAAVAKSPTKKHKRYAAHATSHVARKAPNRGQDQWYERDASKLPFGSTIWWDQMLRENRLTCCN